MQQWDRLVMIGVGVVVSICTGRRAWPYWQRRRYRAVAGFTLLILGAVGVPVLLAVIGP